MTFVPFEILITVFGISFALPILGYIYRTQFPMSMMFFLAGASWLILFLTTDSISLGEKITLSENTITPTQVDYMNVNTGTGFTKLSAGGVNNIFVGEEIVNTNSLLYNKRIDQVCLSLSKTGNPTGTAIIAVYDSTITPTSANYKFLFGTKDSTTFATTQTTYCFIAVNNYITTTNEAIGIFFIGGSAGNEINIFTDISGSVFDGTNSYRTQYVASWSDTTNRDIRASISLTAIEESIVNAFTDKEYFLRDVVTLEPTLVGIIFIIFSLSFIIIGVLIEVKFTT